MKFLQETVSLILVYYKWPLLHFKKAPDYFWINILRAQSVKSSQ